MDTTDWPENKTAPGVSAVIPLFNKGRYIRRALDSVLAQTFSVREVIVVDDGSTDDGPDIVSAVEDRRIRLIRQSNVGVSAARNRGVAEARLELIAFLDADDEWAPSFLETILRLRERFPQCGVYATAYTIAEGNGLKHTPSFDGVPAPPWEGILPNYFRSAPTYPVWTSAAVVPKRVFESAGLFPVGVARGEDLDMWCRIALRYPIAFSSRAQAIWHLDADNRTPTRRPAPHYREYRLLDTIGEALNSAVLPSGVAPSDLAEYRNKKLLELASINLGNGNLASTEEHLQMAASTRRFRRLWLKVRARTDRKLADDLLARSRFWGALMPIVRGAVLSARLVDGSGLKTSLRQFVQALTLPLCSRSRNRRILDDASSRAGASRHLASGGTPDKTRSCPSDARRAQERPATRR